MSKLTIISAANNIGIYAHMLSNCIKNAQRFDYGTRVYDLGGLNLGIRRSMPNDKVSICMRKPTLILNALEVEKGPILWMDADTLMVKHVDELVDPSYDVAIFYSRRKRRKCFTAGIMYLNNTRNSRDFVQSWIDKIRDSDLLIYREVEDRQLGDQIFLNDMIYQDHVRGGRFLNTTKIVAGSAKVRFLDADIYNTSKPIVGRRKPREDEKILHWRGAGENKDLEKYDTYVEKWGLLDA